MTAMSEMSGSSGTPVMSSAPTAASRTCAASRVGRPTAMTGVRATTRGEQWHGERGELGDGREPRREPGGVQRTVEQVTDRARSATSNPEDAFASTPDLSKVLTAWFDMAGNMMKLQQQFFATVLGAGNTNDRPTTKVGATSST